LSSAAGEPFPPRIGSEHVAGDNLLTQLDNDWLARMAKDKPFPRLMKMGSHARRATINADPYLWLRFYVRKL